MPYAGQTYKLPQISGWNANPNYNQVPIEAMIDPININHHKGGREPRGGCESMHDAITGTPGITGGYQFTLENGNTFVVVGCSNGTIYTSDQGDFSVVDTQLQSGLGSDKYYHFETFYNKLYICNGYNIPQVWDGAAGSTSNMSNYPSDWSGTSYPTMFIKHGVRANKRLWTFLGNFLYASVSGSDDMSDANVTTIKIMCDEITGLIEFGGRLLAFSRDKTFIIDDESLDVAEWGYQAAVWEGGAANQRCIVKTPTDVMVVPETLEPFSITASQQYGDYQIASLVRPSYLHKWIETNLDLSEIAQFHACYDPELRAIKIFCVGIGKSYPDLAMVFFIDLGPQAGWTKHEYLVDTLSSWVVRVSASDWKIFAGGSAGKTFKLESSTLRDDGEIYRTEWSIPPLSLENPRSQKRFDKIWLEMQPLSFETLSVNVYIDDRSLTGGYHIVDEYGNFLGDENGNLVVSEPTDPWEIEMEGYKNILKSYGDDVGAVGMRIQCIIYNTLGENFFVTMLMFDVSQEVNSYNNGD